MRGFVDALRAALRALAGMTWKLIQFGGRLVWTLVPGSATPPMPDEPIDEVAPALAEPLIDPALQAIRELAHALVGGTATAEHFAGVPERAARWLMTMPPTMLKSVVCTTDTILRGHLNGRATIGGLLLYEPAAVSEYAAAARRDRERAERLASVRVVRRYEDS